MISHRWYSANYTRYVTVLSVQFYNSVKLVYFCRILCDILTYAKKVRHLVHYYWRHQVSRLKEGIASLTD